MILEAAARLVAAAIVPFNVRHVGTIAPRAGIAVVQPGHVLWRRQPSYDNGHLCAALAGAMMDGVRTVVEQEGTTLNQGITVAAAENLATLRTADTFRERAARADRDWRCDVLETGAGDDPPRLGDEPPERWQDR